MSGAFTSALSPRQQQILAAVCRDYIVSGTEVSSAGLIRTHGFLWSSATIRQELAVLERDGFVHRPHCSSGRLPTQAGLEYYIRSLPSSEPSPAAAAALDRSLRAVGQRLESDLRAASCVLSGVAGCVAVAFWGASRGGKIADIDVVPLVAPRALVALTMDDRSTVMHPVMLERWPEKANFEAELRRLQECLRSLCRGRTLAQARAELLDRQREVEAQFDARLAETLRVGLTLCAGASLDPLWLHVAGQPSLVRDVTDVESIGDVLSLLDDVHRLADVLCQLFPDEGDPEALRARVHVGLDETPRTEGIAGIALVGCRLRGRGPNNEGRTGAVALLGSPRMDYAALIPLVEYAARTLATHTEA